MSEALTHASWTSWCAWVLSASIASGLVLVAVLVLDLLLARRVGAGWRSALYLAVFARLALPLAFTSPVGVVASQPVTVAAPSTPRGVTTHAAVAASSEAPGHVAAPSRAGLALHAFVTATLLASWLLARRRVMRTLARALPAGERVASLAPDALEHATAGPAVFGLLRPRIVMPAPLVGTLDDDALASVVRHEQAHVARRDAWRLALLQIATFLAWPLAPAWIAAWRVRGLIEQACDERALRGAGAQQRRALGRALVTVAQFQPLRARLALGMLPFGGGLASRLRALRHAKRWPGLAQAALVATLAITTVLASGTRPVRAAAPSIAVPPVVELRVDVFAGDDLMLPFRDGVASPDVLQGRGGEPWRISGTGQAERVRSALAAQARFVESLTLRSWLGGRVGVPDGVVHDLQILPRVDAEVVSLGLAGHDGDALISANSAIREPGMAAVVSIRDAATGGATHAVVTATNASWTPWPTFASPRADVDIDETSVMDAVEEVQRTFGVPIVQDDPSDARVRIRLRGATADDVVAEIARQTGLEPCLDDGGILRLAETSRAHGRSWASSSPEEALVRDVFRRECGAVDLSRDGERMRASGRAPAPLALANALRSLEESPDLEDVALESQQWDAATQSTRFSVSMRAAAKQAVSINWWTVDARALEQLFPDAASRHSGWIRTTSGLSAASASAFSQRMNRLVAGGHARDPAASAAMLGSEHPVVIAKSPTVTCSVQRSTERADGVVITSEFVTGGATSEEMSLPLAMGLRTESGGQVVLLQREDGVSR